MTAIAFVVVLASAGLGVVVYGLAGAGVELLAKVTKSRFRRALEAVMQSSEEMKRVGLEEEVGGVPHLASWMVLCGVVGLAVTWVLIPGEPGRFLGLLAGIAPLLWRRRRMQLLRQQIRRDVADLLENIRLQMAFGGSLVYALSSVGPSINQAGLVYRRLQFYQKALILEGPEFVLEKLSGELDSSELRTFLIRLGIAQQGQMSYEQALADAVSEAIRENRRIVEADIEGAPLRLLLPMLFLMFPPVLALALYPPAYALISQLAGAGSSVIP